MYFTSHPDHTKPGFDAQLHFSKFKKFNIIFNALTSRSYCERHVGCLSIKTVLSSEEWYGIDKRQIAVRRGQFLILNNNQEYSSRIDTSVKARSISVFFKNEFACSVLHDVVDKEETLLDRPFEPGKKPLEFFQTLHSISHPLKQNLFHLISALNSFGYEVNMVDEHLFHLLRHMIRAYKTEVKYADKVNAIKLSTRKEIFKRLCIAKDFMHSTYMNRPDLNEICNQSLLSTPQLIRQFNAVFHKTPHQYLTQIKLSHATELLYQTSIPVEEITWRCGFDNSSAFCRAFKSAFGISPLTYRFTNK